MPISHSPCRRRSKGPLPSCFPLLDYGIILGFGHLWVRLPSRILQHVQIRPHHKEDFSLRHRILAADVDHFVEQHCAVEDGPDLFLFFTGLKVRHALNLDHVVNKCTLKRGFCNPERS